MKKLMFVIVIFLAGIFLFWYLKLSNSIPNAVDDAVLCAKNLYENAKTSGMIFGSQCLGTCGEYAVDIVHVPRNADDDKPGNQCDDYINGKVSKFIELDKNGKVVRVVS